MLSGVRLTVSSLVLCLASSAGGQENLDKNKTGAQLYASHCAACHKSPQSVTKTTEDFVSEHYPLPPESAVTIATYLNGLKKPEPPRGRAAKRKRTSQATPLEPRAAERIERGPRAAGRGAAASGNKAGPLNSQRVSVATAP